MRKIHLKLLRDISNQKWQFSALVLIVFLGTLSFSGMTGMIEDVERSINRTLDQLHFQDILVTFDRPLPANVSERLSSVEGVGEILGRLVWDTGLFLSNGKQVHARLVGIPATGMPTINQLHLLKGRYLHPDEEISAILDHHFADYHHIEPGQSLDIVIDGEHHAVQVVGTAISPEYLMAVSSKQNPLPFPGGFAILFVDQVKLERLLGIDASVNQLCISLREGSRRNISPVLAKIESSLEGLPVKSISKRSDNPSYNLLMMDLEDGREMMSVVSGVFLLVAAMSIYVLLSRMVFAQRVQIGIMKALGYSSSTIASHYMLYSLIIGLSGSAAGLIASYPAGRVIAEAYARELGLPFVQAGLHTSAALGAFLLTVFVCLVSGFFPARSSAKIAPSIAMRTDPSLPAAGGSVSLVEKLLGRLVRLNTNWKIVLRNISRNRRRTATSAAGFFFAFVVLLSSWSLFDALNYTLDLQFNRTDLWDLHPVFSLPQLPTVLARITSIQGVMRAEPTLETPAVVRAGGAEKEVYIVAIDPGSTLHGFQLPPKTGPRTVLRPGVILLPINIGRQLGIRSGDNVSVRTPFSTVSLEAAVESKEATSPRAYVNLSWIREKFAGGLEIFNGVLISVDRDTLDDVTRELYHLPGISNVEVKKDLEDGWRSLLGMYYVMMGIFLAFGLAIAGAVILNITTINVLERERELATMRALGQSRGSVARLVALENLLVGILSIPGGIVVGILTSLYIFRVWTSSSDFYFPFHLSLPSCVLVTILILVTAFVSQIPALRKANRINLAEATKVIG